MNKKTTSVFSIFLIIILCVSLLASCGEIKKLDQSSVEKITVWTQGDKMLDLSQEEKVKFTELYNAAEYDSKANGQGGTPQFGITVYLSDQTEISVNDFFTKLEVTIRNKKGKIKAWYYINSQELYTFMSELANEIEQTETVKTCEHTFEQIQNLNKYTGVKKCSICGMSKTVCRNIIAVKNGVAHISNPKNTPEIICTKNSRLNDKEMKIEDASFVEKLLNVIEGKIVGDAFCNCHGDYEIVIDNNYTFRLHRDRIEVFSINKEITGFTIECLEDETEKLYDILEKMK